MHMKYTRRASDLHSSRFENRTESILSPREIARCIGGIRLVLSRSRLGVLLGGDRWTQRARVAETNCALKRVITWVDRSFLLYVVARRSRRLFSGRYLYVTVHGIYYGQSAASTAYRTGSCDGFGTIRGYQRSLVNDTLFSLACTHDTRGR